MEKSKYKIYIIGAGIGGLTAALVLEKFGYHPIILEATNEVGGRVKTEIVEGYQLDHGFQVMLDAYPKVKEFLDLKSLNLQTLKPGAVIFTGTDKHTIGDPLRDPSFIWSTLSAGIGTFTDKIKVLKLNNRLKKISLEEIFSSEEITTLEYLRSFGFSDSMIEGFFRPFFSGIFLEDQLETSSRMFKFVYKMFGEGSAVVPKAGIQAIPKQMASKLNHTEIHFNRTVEKLEGNNIVLKDGSTLESHFTIVATDPHRIIPALKGYQEWKGCDTLYFECDERILKDPIIGLISNKEALVNNFFYHSSVNNKETGPKQLLSVTVVKDHKLNDVELVSKVRDDLKNYCEIEAGALLKHFKIPKALPRLSNLLHDIEITETQLTTSTFLAGDQQLNGSLNAAMTSGERAALGVINTLENGMRVGALTSEYR